MLPPVLAGQQQQTSFQRLTSVWEEADLIYNMSTGGHHYFHLGHKDKR